MRSILPGYYRPTAEEFQDLWLNGLVIPDANVLLNLHRYPEETAKEILEVFTTVGERLWVPHQAAIEYQENWLHVIDEQRLAYKTLRDDIVRARNQLEQGILLFKRHPILKAEDLIQRITGFFSELEASIGEREKRHPEIRGGEDPLTAIELREQLTLLLEGKVGPSFPADRLSQIETDGKKRYERKQPPGYADRDKPESQKFGDLTLWMQILEKAKETKQSILFITDDQKEDWWWIHQGKTIGPRPELIKEIKDEAAVRFYIYQTSRFLGLAPQYLKKTVSPFVIAEVEKVGDADRKSARNVIANILQKVAEFNQIREVVEAEHRRADAVSSGAGTSDALARLVRQMQEARQLQASSEVIKPTTSMDALLRRLQQALPASNQSNSV